MVFVCKKDGIVCWCIDNWKLNDCIKKNVYFFLYIDMCLDCLVGVLIFFIMDL